MEEPFGLLKIETGFNNDGVIIKKQDMFHEINYQLLNSKHTLTLGQLMHLTFDLK
jgi:hypothetical protein